MLHHSSTTEKSILRSRSVPIKKCAIITHLDSSKGNKFRHNQRQNKEEETNKKESYNGGSTYGEHS